MNYVVANELFVLEKAASSKDARLSSCHSNVDDVLDDGLYEQDESTLWCIDDDSMFFARGLKNHSAGKGKSVFVTWNENYLLNFVFKTSSKTKKTTLTKVRLTLPLDTSGEPEEIVDMLILDLNTLLLMRSGRVYYFSSVKSIHPIAWLENVRCVTAYPNLPRFSVIRFRDECDEEQTPKQLLLEVYQDTAQLGKCLERRNVLIHCYDISFDLKNLFNCDWHEERYLVLSLVSTEENIDFLRKLLTTANAVSMPEERTVIEVNQEVHIFAVSGNLFMLVGALHSEDKSPSAGPNVEEYSILLLNSYATSIECVKIDATKNLLIVLLQSGHLDVWYKSKQMLGSIQHLNHEVTYFTNYDYNSGSNTFYITSPEEVTKIQVMYSSESSLCECRIREQHKAICGIIACTWVENLQQLVCLSYNNIFYRLCFLQASNEEEYLKDVDVKYENYNNLYTLSTNKLKEMLSKSEIINNLLLQPEQIHHAIEAEFQKQQLLALGCKSKMWQKIFDSHIEYHKTMPSHIYIGKVEVLLIRAAFDSLIPEHEENSLYCLIFLNLIKSDNAFTDIAEATSWYLDIFNRNSGQSLLISLPAGKILQKRICLAIRYTIPNTGCLLPDLTLRLRTFIHLNFRCICLNIDIDIQMNEKTFYHAFTNDNVQQWSIMYSNVLDPNGLIKKFKKEKLNISKSSVACGDLIVQQQFKVKKLNVGKLLDSFDIKNNMRPSVKDMKIFFLQYYPLQLSYNDETEILSVSAKYAESLLFFKLYLKNKISLSKKEDNIDLTESGSEQLKIMQFQADVERLYGSLLSPATESMDIDSVSTSLHLENLHKVYLKLRSELIDIFENIKFRKL